MPDTPNLRRSVLTALIYMLVLAGLASLNSGLLVLALPLVLYRGISLLSRPELPRLEVERRLSATQINPEEPVQVKLTVTNAGLTGLEEVYLEEIMPPSLRVLTGQTRVLTTLRPQESLTLEYTLSGPRGSYELPGLRVVGQDTLGLFTQTTTLSLPDRFLVLPALIRLRRVVVRPAQTRLYAGQIPTRQGGPGVEFFGVREYQTGDLPRWINSRATARHAERIFINEFRQERMADIGLILDARRQSNVETPAGSLFEHGVQATAALANEFLNGNNRVGLFIYGDKLDWTYPGYGKIQRQRILWALARARVSDSEVFAKLEYLPTRLFAARAQLVFVSPLLFDDAEVLLHLRARGYQLLIVSPNPVVFEQAELGSGPDVELATRLAQLERDLLLAKLRQAGIRVLDWPVEIPFQQAAHLALGQPGPR